MNQEHYAEESQNEEVVTAEEHKQRLLDQITNKKNTENNGEVDAVQERKADELHVRKDAEAGEQVDQGESEEEKTDDRKEESEGIKTIGFTKGDEQFEIPEDAEIEIKADGKRIKMNLSEMRDAAAGGVAVRNRMRQLADERKELHTPLKQFAKNYENDPLLALKKVFGVIKKLDPNSDMNKFLGALGKQAQNLAQMSPSERKAYELERELDETKSTLSEKDRLAKIQEMQQELVEDGISEEQILEYSHHLLNDPVIAKSIESEDDLFDRIVDLSDEIDRQQAVLAALQKVDSNQKIDDPLVFELSALLEKNPDFDESDLEEIVTGILSDVSKSKAKRALSKRHHKNKSFKRSSSKDHSKMSPKEAIKAQILEKKKATIGR